MIKKKADIGLDEWLRLEPALARVEDARTTAVESEVGSNPTPANEVSPTREETDVAASLAAEVASNQDDPSEWFWVLLEQSGHERW